MFSYCHISYICLSLRYLSILCLLICEILLAQDTIYLNSIYQEVGKHSTYKYTSPTTGTKQKVKLKTGQWKYYDNEGVLLKSESYTTSGKSSFLNGIQTYFNYDGEPVLTRSYSTNVLQSETPLLPCVMVLPNDTVTLLEWGDSVYIYEPPVIDYTWFIYDNVLRINTIEDPNAPAKLAKYKHFEDSIGNIDLLRKGAFTHRHPQNVVANPSFEDHPTLTLSKTSFNDEITSWFPASPTPDFQIAPVVARSGIGFIGIRIYSESRDIEYVGNKLNHRLLKGQKYCFSAYVKLGPSSVPTDAFGVHFSANAITFKKIEDTDYTADLLLANEFLTYKSRWMLLQCIYTANGSENWMSLGSFKPIDQVNLKNVPGGYGESYYYIDDISLVPITSEGECPCNLDGDNPPPYATPYRPDIPSDNTPIPSLDFKNLNVGDKLILENVYFDIDKYELLPTSLETLNELYAALLKYSTIYIEISGHTSTTGGYTHNVTLSKNRAKAVLQFLVEKGINLNRLTSAGYGSDSPIAPNSTEENRQMNRRVEVKVLEK
jgi:OOP family OmpA-OmpF porin